MSERQILAELGNVYVSMICDRGSHAEYLLPSKATEEGIRLYQAVKQTLQRQTILFQKEHPPEHDTLIVLMDQYLPMRGRTDSIHFFGNPAFHISIWGGPSMSESGPTGIL